MSEKKVYRVDIERRLSTCMYVLADNPQDAEADAGEFHHSDFEWDEDKRCWSQELPDHAIMALTDHEVVWSGGPEGEDILVKELKELAIAAVQQSSSGDTES